MSLPNWRTAGSVQSMRKTSDLIWQDAQHQLLFDVLDTIGQPGVGGEVLQRLQQYTETHFALEERYMELLDFPGLDAHRQAHDRFRAEIDELMASDFDQDSVVRDYISTYLTEWLTRHVFGIDKELEAFILASDAR